MGEVLHLFQLVERGEPVREFEEVLAVENKGFRDCLHGRSESSRQVLLMDIETLELFGIPPGRTKENITTRGIELSGLPLGQRIRVGEALLEITKACTPCNHMDEIRAGLQEELRGRRGVLCRVIEPGKIRRGERIKMVGQAEASARG
ncbi:MAG: MOSC domain-containing protein [Acidobacteriia bacterium]|nr:MOSC domain-containing protein [Terriglobia bacterium]